jgi:hypothetical protein
MGEGNRVSMPMAAVAMVEADTAAFETTASDMHAAHMAAASATAVAAGCAASHR